MAHSPQPLGRTRVGQGVAALLLGLFGLCLGAVAFWGGGLAALSAGDWAAARFTVVQAAMSALLSVGLAVPLARALVRRRIPARPVVLTLLGVPFLLPVLVAILGLLAVYGRGGIVSQGLGLVGADPIEIYGLTGVVLAHVFFNLPLATRLILQGWQSIPAERVRLAQSLGFGSGAMLRHIEGPMLRAVLPGVALVVFLICTTSFAVALTLGGGPRATTLELAIYQAFRFNFDLARAASLGLLQVALCALAVLATRVVPLGTGDVAGLDRQMQGLGRTGRLLRTQDALVIGAAGLFLMAPLVMVVLRGLPALPDLPLAVLAASGRSVALALASVVVMLVLTLPLALALAAREGGLAALAGALPIAVSPLVLGLGLFILLRPWVDPVSLALPLTALVNAVMSLPFVLRALVPDLRLVAQDYGRLALSLGMTRRAWLRLVVLPRLRRPLGFGMGLTAALSMGDLGVIALFADPARGTLPLLIYQLMGSYRTDSAAAAVLVLLVLTLALFFVFDRGGRMHAEAG